MSIQALPMPRLSHAGRCGAGFVPQVWCGRECAAHSNAWKDFVEHGFVIAGSAATVRATLRHAITDMRVGISCCCCKWAICPMRWRRENTQRFAQRYHAASQGPVVGIRGSIGILHLDNEGGNA